MTTAVETMAVETMAVETMAVETAQNGDAVPIPRSPRSATPSPTACRARLPATSSP